MSKITNIINRVDQLEKEIKELRKELEKEMRGCQQDYPEPEKESPPFESWVK